MEILLNHKDFDDSIHYGELKKEEFQKIINDIDIEGVEKYSIENIGPGADVMTILLYLGIAYNVFIAGGDITSAIDGWKRIGEKLLGLKRKKYHVTVDVNAALAMAVYFLAQKEQIETLSLEDEHTFTFLKLDRLFTDGRDPNSLISKPYNFYTFSLVVNSEKNYIIGVKSIGEPEILKCFEFANGYGITEIDHD